MCGCFSLVSVYSRKQCGVVTEQSVVLVVVGGSGGQGKVKGHTTARAAVSSLIQDQGTHWSHLNILR